MKVTDIFVPVTAGTSVNQIAEDLFDYYDDAEDSGVGTKLVQVDSKEEFIKLLTPEVCQEYVNRIHEEVDPYEGLDAANDAEQTIIFETLEKMGLLGEYEEDED